MEVLPLDPGVCGAEGPVKYWPKILVKRWSNAAESVVKHWSNAAESVVKDTGQTLLKAWSKAGQTVRGGAG